MFGRQDAEENVLLRATEAADKLIKVSSLLFMNRQTGSSTAKST